MNSIRANKGSKLPNSASAPHVVLSRELISPTDIRFVSHLLFIFDLVLFSSCDQIAERAQSTSEALSNLDIKQGEPLVVQFATI